MNHDHQYNSRLTIAYDGTAYHGWQIQPNGISIQQLVEKALYTVLRTEVRVIGAGRTDAGVHALGQVAHFKHPHSIDTYRLIASLNGLLPRDIRILRIDSVPLDFHAQYGALGKIYHYHLCLDQFQDPFRRLYSFHVREKINPELLKSAAEFFVGRHDFTSFANSSQEGCAAHDAVRIVHRMDVVEEEGRIRLEFEGDGFLYKMVRNLVGTALEVASGRRAVESIPEIFAAKDRRRAGQAAPPHGLFLVKVFYGKTEGGGRKTEEGAASPRAIPGDS